MMPDIDNLPPNEQPTLPDIRLSEHDAPTLRERRAASRPRPIVGHVRRRPATAPFAPILLGSLALLLVVGGLGFVIFATTTQYTHSIQAQATRQVFATFSANRTAQAKTAQVQQATAQALATQQASIYATATAVFAGTATIQAGSDSATATAAALQTLLTKDTTSTPAFTDPLSDNSSNNQWDENINAQNNTGCAFINSAYHALEAQFGYLQPCFEQATSFSNFVYQVSMTIDSGSQGGIIFRADKAAGQYYIFRAGTDGSYMLEYYNGALYEPLASGFSQAISTGLNQSNTLAVIADKHTLSLFVNSTFIVSVTDNTFSSGEIGVIALDSSTPTDVEFSNAQLWKL